ncbi:helix-turn-helix transcriptional regulator [Vibrio parahaemolyticus]|uniref:helix-turn-helix domain-containing protein n=1 Tax=Vibrio parahaemolyticus TaxID=670 RepID=UPI00215C4242|nr:helix-turn-helix transcriptional regulator [Vibrio parahaemolyticus]MCR9728106.1 helix-turn-helix transcriptional regulator [Vibrio parahaemolyticus]MCR9754223.1 helix-turn-helix transcriptional regulator [Vibrio parahaemolyticus]MCR9786755.1 helix-turn-helix transcriptional regulator [Vibrio parahaemolyticus]MCR9862423.1 helix-turn-helix transcriptional regulator [Vibrio parahaemolyticus]MCZ6378783.1 helix-turn-helix transcriptional regulator [Vibrio parahaemolyticus]
MTDNDKKLLKILRELELETLSISNAKLLAPAKISHLIDDERASIISANIQAARTGGVFSEMSQAKLADRMGVERTVVGKMERTTPRSAMNHLIKASVAMNVSVIWLAFGNAENGEIYRGRYNKTARLFEAIERSLFGLIHNQYYMSDKNHDLIDCALEDALNKIMSTELVGYDYFSFIINAIESNKKQESTLKEI